MRTVFERKNRVHFTSEGPIHTCTKNALCTHQAVRLERPFPAFIFPKILNNLKYINLDKVIWSRNKDHRQICTLKTNFIIPKYYLIKKYFLNSFIMMLNTIFNIDDRNNLYIINRFDWISKVFKILKNIFFKFYDNIYRSQSKADGSQAKVTIMPRPRFFNLDVPCWFDQWHNLMNIIMRLF